MNLISKNTRWRNWHLDCVFIKITLCLTIPKQILNLRLLTKLSKLCFGGQLTKINKIGMLCFLSLFGLTKPQLRLPLALHPFIWFMVLRVSYHLNMKFHPSSYTLNFFPTTQSKRIGYCSSVDQMNIVELHPKKMKLTKRELSHSMISHPTLGSFLKVTWSQFIINIMIHQV